MYMCTWSLCTHTTNAHLYTHVFTHTHHTQAQVYTYPCTCAYTTHTAHPQDMLHTPTHTCPHIHTCACITMSAHTHVRPYHVHTLTPVHTHTHALWIPYAHMPTCALHKHMQLACNLTTCILHTHPHKYMPAHTCTHTHAGATSGTRADTVHTVNTPMHAPLCTHPTHVCTGAHACTHTGSTPAAAAESLQSCPTLCDPIDGSPPGSPVPGILQARTLEWVAISISNP